MNVPVSQAKAQLADLVRRAEQGEDVVLTRHGRPVARLAATEPDVIFDPEARMRLIRELQERVRLRGLPSVDAARSQDFLYDEDGLPA